MLKNKMANNSLKLNKNRFCDLALKSPTQMGSLNVNISATNISRFVTPFQIFVQIRQSYQQILKNFNTARSESDWKFLELLNILHM